MIFFGNNPAFCTENDIHAVRAQSAQSHVYEFYIFIFHSYVQQSILN